MNYELILGIIGTSTGVLSLVFLIYKYVFVERPKLVIDYFMYEKPKFSIDSYGASWEFKSDVLIHNKGNKSTTINKIYFDINKELIEPDINILPFNISPNTSKKFLIDYVSDNGSLTKRVDEILANCKKNKEDFIFTIYLDHTYGRISKYKIINKFSSKTKQFLYKLKIKLKINK